MKKTILKPKRVMLKQSPTLEGGKTVYGKTAQKKPKGVSDRNWALLNISSPAASGTKSYRPMKTA
jgi:hypothetical protein